MDYLSKSEELSFRLIHKKYCLTGLVLPGPFLLLQRGSGRFCLYVDVLLLCADNDCAFHT